MQGFNAEHLQEKWAPILNHEGLGGINDAHKRMVTAVLLENQEKMLNRGSVSSFQKHLQTQPDPEFANFDPVLISLIRRAMPNLVAYDLAGVQPMNGPTGLIFAMRSRFTHSEWYRSICSTKQIPDSPTVESEVLLLMLLVRKQTLV